MYDLKSTPKSQGILLKIIPSYSVYPKTILWRFQASIYKNVDFFFLPEERSCVMCVSIFYFFFFTGDFIEPKVLEDQQRDHLNGKYKF